MAHPNEISPATVAEWVNNFNNQSPNIFEVFQENEIILSKEIYETLCTQEEYHLRFYMGLEDSSTPKIIAVGAFPEEDEKDVYTDILDEGKIYELYAGNSISLSDAQGYIANWKDKLEDDLFKYAFLIPRTNLVKFFEDDELEEVKIFFGLDTNIKPIMQKPNPASGDPSLNFFHPCPPYCDKNSELYS